MKKTNHIIFGGKGFIGQNLAKAIIKEGGRVLIVDKNQWELDLIYQELLDESQVKVLHADILSNLDDISDQIKYFIKNENPTKVWHLAANSDILAGNMDVDVDLNDTFLTTVNILKLLKNIKVDGFYFASSSAVYGDALCKDDCFKEDSATQPISNYGAMKLASEAIIRAAHQQYLNRCIIFRFPNVIGFPATHGVILDFIRKLEKTPKELIVLGDGNQNKPYLHVQDLVSAMLHLEKFYINSRVMETINIGSPYENVFVKQIASEVRSRVSPNATIYFGETPFGWVGDMPTVKFNIEKILATKWQCQLSGINAVRRTIDEIIRAGEK